MRALGWLRAPLLHFLAGGAVLFRLAYGPAPFSAVGGGEAAAPIVVTAADVARLRADYTRETGLVPTTADEAALVQNAIEEELLFREALARGLDRNDRSVRNWLIEQMTVLSDGRSDDPDRLYAEARALGLDRTDLVVRRMLVQKMRLLAARTGERPPSDDTLRAFYERHRTDYTPPPRLSLWHVFFASATHGDATSRAAETLLAAVRRDGRPPADAVREGDSFAVPPRLVAQSPSQLEKLFGPAFAARVLHAEAHGWIGPVPSAYGTHLVWVDGHEPATPPPFESVRERVYERWQEEQRKRRVVALLRDLERRHPLRVESAAWRPRSLS